MPIFNGKLSFPHDEAKDATPNEVNKSVLINCKNNYGFRIDTK